MGRTPGRPAKKEKIMDNMKNQNGNILTIAMIFIAIIISIFIFIIAIFMSNVNGIIYGVKTDMYTINKSAVVSVNKNQANVDKFTYSQNEYKKYFEEVLRKNYKLNENLENKNGLIEKIKIEEYKIYKKGEKDNFTKEKCDDVTIHTVVTIKIKPIILSQMLEDIFTFKIHEDVNLNMVKTHENNGFFDFIKTNKY